jgi:hypothetical protein
MKKTTHALITSTALTTALLAGASQAVTLNIPCSTGAVPVRRIRGWLLYRR